MLFLALCLISVLVNDLKDLLIAISSFQTLLLSFFDCVSSVFI